MQVCQAFDESKFNFKKAFLKEVLFRFEPQSAIPQVNGRAPEGEEPGRRSCIVESALCDPSSSPNLVVINVSPIEYGHVLLVPRVLDNLAQRVDPAAMELALHFAKEADNRCFRVGFNSLGAYATINHLHFQAYYMDATLPCERAATEPLTGDLLQHQRKRRHAAGTLNGSLEHCVTVSTLVGYPVRGFVIELAESVPVADGISEMALVVGRACQAMQQANVAHNLLITDSGRRVFLWPQCFAERHASGGLPESVADTGVNPAVFEIAGHVLLKRQQDYDELAEDERSVVELLSLASMSEQRFRHVAELCFGCEASKGAF